ncbi:MAG TPA: LptA/OstA family protein [Bryobacteraceae bacterium]|nr:LptA/OstA family protein [Bryobacteraceae bacterium]
MRRTRWLLLVAMAAILSVVFVTYRAQKQAIKAESPPKPKALPLELNSTADLWEYTEKKGEQTTVKIFAKEARQTKDSARIDLTEVQLRLYHKTGDAFDLVKSAAATYFANDHKLYSGGDVDITLGEPAEGEPKPDLVSIHSSGVTFDTTGGKAETDRPCTFTFRNGVGKANGGYYDPTTHELLMKKDVEVDWHPPGANAKPMKIEATSLTYQENNAQILLQPWGKLTRDTTVVEGFDSVIHLQDKALKKVESNRAHGTDEYPNRHLQYAADSLVMEFDDDGYMQKITGQGNASLTSISDTSETTISAARVEMNFAPADQQSVLSHVNTSGNSVVTAKPRPAPGHELGETHVLRSEVIELKMRPGGKDIEEVLTHSPGKLEFLPNQPDQHHRTLDGSDMVIAYSGENHIDSFRAKQVKTHTDPTAEERKRNTAATLTASREMVAHFEPNSSQVASIEQQGDFSYEEGDRRARAAKATLDQKENVMLLDAAARVWDANGSTSADHIRLDQKTGNFTAEGKVNSSRLPEKDQKNSMLSGDQPMQGQAQKMISTNRNRTVHYEGSVNLWQGANRIQANTIDVDREKKTLIADGNVITNLWDQPKAENENSPASPAVLTVVRAAHLVYTDQDRLAVYTGGVVLNHTGLRVKSRELRAFLADSSADSRLQKAFAEGSVEIVQSAPDRTRTGTGEHGEYYPDEQKVVLRGGKPRLVDSLKGDTSGDELTYFANDDRLQVNGSAEQPVRSRLQKRK